MIGGIFYGIFLLFLKKIGFTMPKYDDAMHADTMRHAQEQFDRIINQKEF